jgi:hypothetical protein
MFTSFCSSIISSASPGPFSEGCGSIAYLAVSALPLSGSGSASKAAPKSGSNMSNESSLLGDGPFLVIVVSFFATNLGFLASSFAA